MEEISKPDFNEQDNYLRFSCELEFVQLLANPEYLQCKLKKMKSIKT
jgi:hypothetical protein